SRPRLAFSEWDARVAERKAQAEKAKRGLESARQGTQERLVPIPGGLPDPAAPLTGCPFEPRCDRRLPECSAQTPDLVPVAESHASACLRATPEGERT